MKRIIIKGISVFAHHGVLPEEKERGQEFVIDVDFGLDEGMADTDNILSTVDYAAVAQEVASIATSARYDLIETLASQICAYLVSMTGVRDASVTVKKPSAPLLVHADWVGVTVSHQAEAPGGPERKDGLG